MSTGNERRKNQRLSGSTIQAEAKRKSIFNFRSYKPVKIDDYNRFGIKLLSDERFRIGEELLLNISRQNDKLENIVGFVCHEEELEGGFGYGVQFDFSANKHMRSTQVEETLSRIEKVVEKLQHASLVKPQTGTISPHSETP